MWGFMVFIKSVLGVFAMFFFIGSSAFAFCFNEAGEYFDINPELLKAIAYTESRLDPIAVNTSNSNGTVDYGLMQINSAWFEKLKSLGISEDDVINDPCTNVFTGAWILALNFQSHGECWESVGAYNAGFSSRKEVVRSKYITIVKSNFQALRESEQ